MSTFTSKKKKSKKSTIVENNKTTKNISKITCLPALFVNPVSVKVS